MDNPYAAPSIAPDTQAEPGAPDGYVYLGFWKRVVASIVDNLILFLLGLFVGLLAVAVPGGMSESLVETAGWVLGVAYVLGFWFARSATPGKMIYRAVILDAVTMRKPSNGKLVLRYIGYIPSALVLCLGFLWVAWDKQKRGWHDMIAGTVVVVPNRPTD